MDPNTTLCDLLLALRSGDRTETLDALEALQGWITRGGFLPSMADPQVSRAIARVVACPVLPADEPESELERDGGILARLAT